MKKHFGVKTLILAALVSSAFGVILTTRLDMTSPSGAQDFWKEPSAKAAANGPSGMPDFVELAKTLMPTVVNISTTQVVKQRPHAPFPEFKTPFDEFFDDEFRQFFEGFKEGEFKRQSLGSGFIINKDGYIITNNHVIENATEIIITLTGRKNKEYKAKVVGRAEKLDVALIKIEAKEDLPVVTLGDSDSLEIGEWVMAIGNPFGFGGTVTAGIVSQKGRILGAGPYDDFIQTDASINPGNSGGPLFNLKGEVVGINTAIIAGGQGIGFAVPVNMAKTKLLQLKETGRVAWGWIGVTIQEVTPELAESFGLKEPKGVLISSVIAGDPAEEAGIKAGDIITEFDGKEILEMHDLPKTVASTTPGKKVKAKVIRNNKEKELFVKVGRMKDGEEAEKTEEAKEDGVTTEERLGMSVVEITPQIAERFNIEDAKGVMVHTIKDDGLAQKAGIKRGDIIKEINGNPVKDLKEFKREMEGALKGNLVRFLIKRGDAVFFAAINITGKE